MPEICPSKLFAIGAQLIGAELIGAQLIRAQLIGAQLTGAQLTGAQLAGTFIHIVISCALVSERQCSYLLTIDILWPKWPHRDSNLGFCCNGV